GLHAAQAVQALEAGKHVLIEKPIALNLADSDAISAAAQKQNRLVGVVSQLRFCKAVNDVKAALESSLLGRIVAADLYMKYYRPQTYYAQNAWRGTRQMDGGGALMNQGIHGVDLLRYLCGPVTSIMAQARTLTHDIEVEDTLAAVVTYASGALGVIQATTSGYPGYPRRLEIHGERGSIILEEDTIIQWSIAGQPEKILEIAGHAQHGHQNPEQISSAGHVAQYANFIAALRGQEPLLVDDREGRHALEIIVRAYESAAKQAIVYL
ncbi:MAG: Gfo/Idh/MocA family oxidoreductase, partial [Clostridiaceae bacterium]|nr:Gfo/Idh/MocA family oxidoreductase [Clostridiaceae bacterium]